MTTPQRDVSHDVTKQTRTGRGEWVLRILAGVLLLSAIVLAIVQPSLRHENASRQVSVTNNVAGLTTHTAGSVTSANPSPMMSPVTLAAGMATTAATPATSAQKPFDAPSKVVALEVGKFTQDLGLVDLSSTHRVTLGIKNDSSQPVRLARVRSECACLSGRISQLELPPGETASFEVTFAAHKEPTLYSGRVLLQAAEGPPVAFVMTVQAHVGMPLAVEPATLDLGKLVVGQECRRDVQIVNNGTKPWRPLYASSTAEGCLALVPRAGIPASGKLAIPVTFKASAGVSGPGKAGVRIQTNCPQQTSLDVAVKYEVSSRYALSAGHLDFGRLSCGDQREVELVVTSSVADAAEFVKECQATTPSGTVCRTKVTYSGSKAVVRCTLEGGKQPGKIEGILKLRLSGHDDPVEVALSGEVAAGGI